MRDADVVLLVVDATVGVTDEDARVAELLRSLRTPVLVVANKVDDTSREPTSGTSCGSGSATRSR